MHDQASVPDFSRLCRRHLGCGREDVAVAGIKRSKNDRHNTSQPEQDRNGGHTARVIENNANTTSAHVDRNAPKLSLSASTGENIVEKDQASVRIASPSSIC